MFISFAQANILITASGRACLADFGLTTVHDTQVSVATTLHGIHDTAGYVAPELFFVWENPNGAALFARLDRRRCDMFTFGCIAYEVTDPALARQGRQAERVPPSLRADLHWRTVLPGVHLGLTQPAAGEREQAAAAHRIAGQRARAGRRRVDVDREPLDASSRSPTRSLIGEGFLEVQVVDHGAGCVSIFGRPRVGYRILELRVLTRLTVGRSMSMDRSELIPPTP